MAWRRQVLAPMVENGVSLAAAGGMPLRTVQRSPARYHADGLGRARTARGDRGQRRPRPELGALVEGLALGFAAPVGGHHRVPGGSRSAAACARPHRCRRRRQRLTQSHNRRERREPDQLVSRGRLPSIDRRPRRRAVEVEP